jgi:hypothetical protein
MAKNTFIPSWQKANVEAELPKDPKAYLVANAVRPVRSTQEDPQSYADRLAYHDQMVKKASGK